MGGQQIDTRTATGKLLLNMLGAIAAFERDLMLERQREGIAKAKQEGKYKGRKPTARNQADAIRALEADGVAKAEIARKLGISRMSVHDNHRCHPMAWSAGSLSEGAATPNAKAVPP